MIWDVAVIRSGGRVEKRSDSQIPPGLDPPTTNAYSRTRLKNGSWNSRCRRFAKDFLA